VVTGQLIIICHICRCRTSSHHLY